MESSEPALLCRSCGLCCDGSLFGRVGLRDDEVASARKLRLKLAPSGTSFEQPCSALSGSREIRACSVYEERPTSCRTFTCRLYERRRREGGSIATDLLLVGRVRALLDDVDALKNDSSAREELTRLLTDHFARG